MRFLFVGEFDENYFREKNSGEKFKKSKAAQRGHNVAPVDEMGVKVTTSQEIIFREMLLGKNNIFWSFLIRFLLIDAHLPSRDVSRRPSCSGIRCRSLAKRRPLWPEYASPRMVTGSGGPHPERGDVMRGMRDSCRFAVDAMRK